MKTRRTLPYIKDAFPSRAQFEPGDRVEIEIELHNPAAVPAEAMLSVDVFSLENATAHHQESVVLKARRVSKLACTVDACAGKTGGFGVDVTLTVGGQVADRLSTAYDVVQKWSDAPRYGFLSGFYRADEADRADVEQLRKYHINTVQFYDWMYRHHGLIPPEDYFTDPLGRELSLPAVRNKIALCHEYGMKALAYGAVYTASREFAAEHPQMMLLRNDGEAETFGDGWQNIMDVSSGSGWPEHIIGQYERAVRELGFDGVHMDTYGYPKTAFARTGVGGERFIRMEQEYPGLINGAKEALARIKPDAGVIFNAVGNWPTAEVAKANQDAVYVEVWDPASRYAHLHGIAENARHAGQKPVILAAYIKPFKTGPAPSAENALRLAQAVISASGAYHLALGERNGVLCDPYYVDHAVIRSGFERTLRNYSDFIVRYAALLYDLRLKDVSMTHAGGINEEYVFSGAEFSSCGEPGRVWTIVKEMPGAKVIHFINLSGVKNDRWNEGKQPPRPVEGIAARVLDNERSMGVFTASPDGGCKLEQLEYKHVKTKRGNAIEFTLPRLEYWRMVYIKTEF